MRHRTIIGALAATLGLLLAAEAAQAQVFGGRDRRGGTSVGIYTPGFSFQYGRPNYGYGSGGYGRGYSPYYNQGYYPSASSWSYPSTTSWQYSNPRPSWGYQMYPSPSYSYWQYSNPRPSWGYQMYPSPSYSYSNPGYFGSHHASEFAQGTGQSGYQSFYPPEQNNSARLQIVVPDPNARVWIQNTQTQQMGQERLFVSPPLESGHQYSYTIRASWMENGKEVTREKTVSVQPGQRSLANFMDASNSNPDKLIAPDRQRTGTDQQTHEGKIVRAGDGKLIMTDMQGNTQHTHAVPSSATIMIDGKVGQLSELREGQKVRVTTRDDAGKTVVRIEADNK